MIIQEYEQRYFYIFKMTDKTGVTGQNIPLSRIYPGLKRPRLDYACAKFRRTCTLRNQNSGQERTNKLARVGGNCTHSTSIASYRLTLDSLGFITLCMNILQMVIMQNVTAYERNHRPTTPTDRDLQRIRNHCATVQHRIGYIRAHYCNH